MKKLAVIACLLLLLGCKPSKRKRDFQDLADLANEPLRRLRPTVAMLLSLDPADHHRIVAVCTSADENLRGLWSLDHQPYFYDRKKFPAVISWYPRRLIWSRHVYCGSRAEVRADYLEDCAKWCLEEWHGLVHDVNMLRGGAVREDVDLVSLSPGWGVTQP